MELETRVACSLLSVLAWAALAAAALTQAPIPPPPTTTTPPTPEWPGCQHNGQLFADGDWVERSPCYVCLCYQRQVICSLPVTCPECPNAIQVEGQCCPMCLTTTTTTTTAPPLTPELPGCFHEGQLYQEGQAVVSDPCYGCWCYGQQVVCSPPPTCAYCENPIQVEGQCCPVCLTTTTTTTTEAPTSGPGALPPTTTPLPPSTNPPRCERDGKIYEPHQPIDTNNPCLHCVCGEGGEELCMHDFCEYFIRPCPNPIRVPGQCCPLCEPTTMLPPETYPPSTTPPEPTCQQDGRVYRHGERIPNSNPCYACSCQLGREICWVQDCREPATCWNPVYLPGECCPVCEPSPTPALLATPEMYPPSTPPEPTCERDGRVFRHGEEIQTNDPCLHCTCDYSGEVCVYEDCYSFFFPCPNPVYTPGQCCPVCEERPLTTTPPTPAPPCQRDGRMYFPGEVMQTGDPCLHCTCDFQGEVCLYEDCYSFFFPCPNPVYTPGQCCPVCEERPPTTTPPTPAPPCQREGRAYFPGEVMETGDPCLHCTCDYSGEVCVYEDCYSFFFPCPNPVYTPGQCCPQCGSTTTTTEKPTTPPGPTPPPPRTPPPSPTPPSPTPIITPTSGCERDGKAFQHGEAVPSSDPCEDCSCQEGQVVCYRRLCLQQFCENPTSVPGQCCPLCAKGCTYKKKTYTHGQVIWTGDPCQQCQCNDGAVDCTVKQCPKRKCKRTVTKPGVCCPVCDKSRTLP